MDNVSRLILSKFLSSWYFTVPIQTLFFFAKGLTFAEIMLLESVLLVGIFLFEIPTGVLGDRIGRKWSLVAGAALGLTAWIPWFLADGFWLFAVSFFISGIGISFQSGSDQALIFDDLKSRGKEEGMQRLIGRYYGGMTLGTALAALIGGFLASSQNLQAFYMLYILNVIMQSAGFLLLLTVKEPPKTHTGEQVEHKPESSMMIFRKGLKRLLTHSQLRRIFLLSLFTTPFSFVLLYIFQPYFIASDVPATWFGIAVFLSSMLSFSAKIFAHRIEKIFGVERGTLLVTLLPGFCWMIMIFVFNPVFSVLLYLLTDASSNIRDPIFSDYLNRHIPSSVRATVLSSISMAGSLYALVARPVIGALADVDLRYAFATMGVLIIAGALLFKIGDQHVREEAHSA